MCVAKANKPFDNFPPLSLIPPTNSNIQMKRIRTHDTLISELMVTIKHELNEEAD